MRRHRVAIVGLGRLGRACALAAQRDEAFSPVGIVRRQASVAAPVPVALETIPRAGHIAELGEVDAALVCVPTEAAQGTAHDLLQRKIPIVECAALHGEAFETHKQALDRMCRHFRVTAMVGAGWDPGALSLFRDLFSVLVPQGRSEVTRRPGVSLHHTVVAGETPGVRDALTTQVRAADGHVQNYVYVQLEEETEPQKVFDALRRDPIFAGEETLVFPVEDLASLEEQGQGVVMQRRGSGGGVPHQALLLEARFSELALAAQVMLAAVRAIPGARNRAYSLLDLPLGALWGDARVEAEKSWI
jgi:diaminopimelate dehydrogenase